MLKGHDIAGVNGAGILTPALAGAFTICKASEGLSWSDPLHSYFVGHLRGAGKLIGHYHYAWVCYDPKASAQNFVRIAAARVGEVLMLDFEEPYHRSARPSSEWSEWVLAFTAEVTRLTGAPCWLYLNDDVGNRLMAAASLAQRAALHELPFVKARYATSPGSMLGWSTLTLWQYSGTHIDGDYFYGDAGTWHALGVPGVKADPPVVVVPVSDPISPKPDPRPTGKITHPFPLPRGNAYAEDDGTKFTHSGVRAADRHAIRLIQRLVGCADVDGRFGAHTKSHVEAFQRAHRLHEDGEVGPATWKALMEEDHFPFPLPAGNAYAMDDGTPTTHSGARAEDRPNIAMIQRHVGVPRDGRYGYHTKAAVADFQHQNRLEADGEVGAHTWRKMF